MKQLNKYTTPEVADGIINDSVFKFKCVEKLFFLIDNYGFNQIKTKDFGRGSIVIFSKKGVKNLYVKVEYEMGILPMLSISFSKVRTRVFYQDEKLQTYPAHYKIQQIVRTEFNSINEYIRQLTIIWEEEYCKILKEISKSLDVLADKAKFFLEKNM